MIKFAKGLKFHKLTEPEIGLLHHAHCSGIAAFPDGELMTVFYWAIKEANRKQAIYACRKYPGSDEWSKPEKIVDDKYRMVGNPAIWIAPDTGKLFLFFVRSWGGWSVCNPRFQVSDDRGKSWSKSKSLYRFISRGIKNPPILTSKGWYILPAYVEFRDYFSIFYISKDGGKTWFDTKARVKIPNEEVPPDVMNGLKRKWGRLVLQPTIVERQDGSILCLMRARRPLGKMYMSESFDGGLSWSAARPYILPNPGGGFHMIRLKSGRIAIIYNHAPVLPELEYERNPLSIALSEDDGKSWKYRRNLIEATGEHVHDRIGGYPTLTQGEDGMIHATWSFAHKGDPNKSDHIDPASGERREPYSFTDIMTTSFSEEWVMQKEFFHEAWEKDF